MYNIQTRIFEKATNKRKLELVAIARKRFKVADKGEYGADYGELEKVLYYTSAIKYAPYCCCAGERRPYGMPEVRHAGAACCIQAMRNAYRRCPYSCPYSCTHAAGELCVRHAAQLRVMHAGCRRTTRKACR
jgi:hypothetical protein